MYRVVYRIFFWGGGGGGGLMIHICVTSYIYDATQNEGGVEASL